MYFTNDGRQLFDSLNSNYPFKNILKLNENDIYLKDKELTFGDVIEFTNILNENFVYDSVLCEILNENENDVSIRNDFRHMIIMVHCHTDMIKVKIIIIY